MLWFWILFCHSTTSIVSDIHRKFFNKNSWKRWKMGFCHLIHQLFWRLKGNPGPFGKLHHGEANLWVRCSGFWIGNPLPLWVLTKLQHIEGTPPFSVAAVVTRVRFLSKKCLIFSWPGQHYLVNWSVIERCKSNLCPLRRPPQGDNVAKDFFFVHLEIGFKKRLKVEDESDPVGNSVRHKFSTSFCHHNIFTLSFCPEINIFQILQQDWCKLYSPVSYIFVEIDIDKSTAHWSPFEVAKFFSTSQVCWWHSVTHLICWQNCVCGQFRVAV